MFCFNVAYLLPKGDYTVNFEIKYTNSTIIISLNKTCSSNKVNYFKDSVNNERSISVENCI